MSSSKVVIGTGFCFIVLVFLGVWFFNYVSVEKPLQRVLTADPAAAKDTPEVVLQENGSEVTPAQKAWSTQCREQIPNNLPKGQWTKELNKCSVPPDGRHGLELVEYWGPHMKELKIEYAGIMFGHNNSRYMLYKLCISFPPQENVNRARCDEIIDAVEADSKKLRKW